LDSLLRKCEKSFQVAKSLISQSCRVVLADHNYDAVQRVAKDFKTSESTFHFMQCDVTDSNHLKDLVQQADEFASSTVGTSSASDEQLAILPGATLLVNCAGITRDNWISQMKLDEWDEVLKVNLKGTFLTCRQFMDQNRADELFPTTDQSGQTGSRPDASIMNIGAIVSELGNLGQVNYAASKGGVMGFGRALAKEVAIRNVRVNSVIPGFIDTPMAQAIPAHVRDRVVSQIPRKRFESSSEVANVVSFLPSPRSGYVTAESVTVSGMISL